MHVEPNTSANAIRRLRRIEGQVAGIARMLEAQRDCRDVVTQISAASKALDQVGFKIVAASLRDAFSARDDAGKDAATQDELEKLFLKLA